MTLSTHVLDASTGRPAADVPLVLDRRAGDDWKPVGHGVTDDDGRCRTMAPDGLEAAVYRLVFDTGAYFSTTGQSGFYPEVRDRVRGDRASATTTYPCSCLHSPTRPIEGADPWPSRWATTSTARRRPASCACSATPTRTRSSTTTSASQLSRRLRRRPPARRQHQVPHHRRHQEHRQRLRQGDRRRRPRSRSRSASRWPSTSSTTCRRSSRVRIKLEAYPWDRLTTPAARTRTRSPVAAPTSAPPRSPTPRPTQMWVVSGVRDLIVLKTTDSEFHTFYDDRYTTLQPTDDRIMATSVTAQWLHTDPDTDWGTSYDRVLATDADTFAGPLQPRAAADPLRDGRGHHQRAARDRRGPVLAAEQAPLRRRPQPVRRGEQERGLPRRRPAYGLHRGHHPPRRRPRSRARTPSIPARAGDGWRQRRRATRSTRS